MKVLRLMKSPQPRRSRRPENNGSLLSESMAADTGKPNSLGGSGLENGVLEADVANDTAESKPSEEPEESPGSTAIDGPPASAPPPPPPPPMDPQLLNAAKSGDATSLHAMVALDPNVLLGRTPAGNTCLHISSAQGHEGFCKDVVALKPSLLTDVNEDDETPLLTAVKSGNTCIASVLLTFCRCQKFSEAVNQKDKKGCNVLHHAIRNGHRELALELIKTEPALSRAVNDNNESAMFISVMRSFTDIFEKLLEISDSAHQGSRGNALRAAVEKGNLDIVKRIMESRPLLAREEFKEFGTPAYRAVYINNVDVLTILLEYDRSLGYLISARGWPLLSVAASKGHVGVARELLNHCPDAPYSNPQSGSTCLHTAISNGHTEFVHFVLGSQQLRKVVNMQDKKGQTALHFAAQKCNSRMISALLLHKDIDVTIYNSNSNTAFDVLSAATKKAEDSIWMVVDGLDTAVPRGAATMDRRLLHAATSGDTTTMMQLSMHNRDVLLGRTPQGNTCLHLSSAHGREGFCKDILALNQSLIDTVNEAGETPLLTAVRSGQDSLASFLLGFCSHHHLDKTILKQDMYGCNALHHAIRSGHKELALELIATEPALSRAVNHDNESPMFIAVMRNFTNVFEKLLKVPDSSHGGTCGYNALHAAVRNGNRGIAKKIVETRSALAREENNSQWTPMHFAVHENKIEVLRVLLEHDFSLGYVVSTCGAPLLCGAAYRGHVEIARLLLEHCPDAPYLDKDGTTCLHTAVSQGHTEFIKFVVQSEHLRKLINMRDNDGDTALHYAIRTSKPKMVAALLGHQDRDITMLNDSGCPAMWAASDAVEHGKTLNWHEVSLLMWEADPNDEGEIYNLNKDIRKEIIEKSRKDIRSLTQTYTSNTSLVAILIATITFAAAFTLPGGYSNDPGSEGLPIMGRKLAFQAFLISDTLAMCSSLTVAFVCVIARWEDLEFLLYYRSFTKKLMWFAYMTTTTAFATGLYTVLAPRLLWLAITVCTMSFFLPALTKLIGEWPILKLRIRMGRAFKFELHDMV